MTTIDSPPPVCPRCGTSLKSDAPEGLCPRCLAAVNFETGSLFTGNGASLPPPPIEEIAPHFPQLEILSCLGRGGMGVVYKARQISLDRLVALKLLAPEREKDPEFSERFAREAQALARMSHPHIVTVHDFGQAGGFFYLLMEYVDGANLRQLLQSHKFTPEQALAVVPPLCDALQYAHDRGIVHRDIKPENLLMDREGKLKVADFGLAKMLGTDASGDERAVGTPSYMAPEQTGDPVNVDNRADIYSLGVVIYEMLTGELPGNHFQPPSSKAAVDGRLDEVVRLAMQQDPDQRYQQASILKTAVEQITQTPPPQVPPVLPASGGDNEKLRETVTLPALVMMIASGLTVCIHFFGVVIMLLLMLLPVGVMRSFRGSFPLPFFGSALGGMEVLLIFGLGVWILISLGLNVAAFVGARRMRKFESYRWAMGSAVILIAMGVLALPGLLSFSVVSILVLVQLGAGIWGLVVLLRPEVKSLFSERPGSAQSTAPVLPLTGEPARRKVAIPAIGLMVVFAINLLAVCGVVFVFLIEMAGSGHHVSGGPVWAKLIVAALIAVFSLIGFIGAWQMRSTRNYTLSLVTAVLALIIPPGFLLGVIFGIWALVMLFDREVRAAYKTEGGGRGCLIAGVIIAAILLLPIGILPITLLTARSRQARPVTVMNGAFQPESVPLPPGYAPAIPQMPEIPAMPVIPQMPDMPAMSEMPTMPGIPTAPATPGPAEPGTAADLAARFDACRTISNYAARDGGLSSIARDAAAAGNATIARQALQTMSSYAESDITRKAVAILLCDHGMRADAVQIAKQITDYAKRDETLMELSTRKAAVVPEPAPPDGPR